MGLVELNFVDIIRGDGISRRCLGMWVFLMVFKIGGGANGLSIKGVWVLLGLVQVC